MKTVWKSTAITPSKMTFMAPEGAVLLTARQQKEHIYVWFLCDPSKPITERSVSVYGTGDDIQIEGKYLGTATFANDELIFHIFENTV